MSCGRRCIDEAYESLLRALDAIHGNSEVGIDGEGRHTVNGGDEVKRITYMRGRTIWG